MKLALWLFLAIGSAHAASEPQQLPPDIGAAYGRLGKAIDTRDEAGMKSVWATDFVVNAPTGTVLRREEVIAAVVDDLLHYKDFKKHITLVDQKPEMVVVMGYDTLVPVHGPGAGRSVRRPFTDVWAERSGAWMLVARQATIAAIDQ